MAISVDISDRLYDYTDEEKITDAIAEFQNAANLTDEEIIALWCSQGDPRRVALEKRIFAAVDANGSVKRSEESVPSGISLLISS